MRGKNLAAKLTALTVLSLLPQTVSADEAADPQTLNKEAAQLAQEGRYDQAVQKWLEALPLVPAEHKHILHKNMGKAYQNWGRLPEAWFHFDEAVRGGSPDPTVADSRTEVADKLRKDGYCRVELVTVPEGAVAAGAPFGIEQHLKTPFSWWFQDGEHVLSFEAPGYLKSTKTLKLAQCRPAELKLTLEAAPVEGKVQLTGTLSGAQVFVDGTALPLGAGGSLSLPQGEHALVVVRPGKADFRTSVKVVAGKTADVNVPDAAIPVAPPPKEHRRPAWAYVAVGAGAAAILAGGATFGWAMYRLDDIDGKYDVAVGSQAEKEELLAAHRAEVEDKVHPLQAASYALWGAGVAAAAAGTWGLVSAGSGGSDKAQADGPRVTVLPLPWGIGAEFSF